jgi:hypothetical protein
MTKTNKNLVSLMQKFEKIVVITLIVTVSLAILSIEGYSLNEIIAQESGEEKGYNFAEDTMITGIFRFNDGPEISKFEVFRQISGFEGREIFVFELEKIVGSNPLLHKAADESFVYRNSPGDRQDRTEFDIKIVISQGSEQKRAFDYLDCYISDYSVFTKTDNEEGWTLVRNSGFAVVDQFEFQCQDLILLNPVYDNMMSNKDEANTESSMDYQNQQKSLGRQ